MRQFDLGSVAAMMTIITEYEKGLLLESRVNPLKQVHDIKSKGFDIEALKTLLDGTNAIAKELGLEGSARFSNLIIGDFNKTNVTNLCDNLKKLKIMIENELREQWFIYIPKDNAWWFNKESSFGSSVIEAFPSSLIDIVEAGNCYALDRPTACVFHAMRVLEYGLCALAKDVGLVFDVQQWHVIIEQIESKIKEQRNLPKTSKKDERLQFLSEAAKEFMYFKDGWRNHVTHRQMIYDMPQAESILSHVKAFMVHLSGKLKE
jgi:hypothetical protein